MADEGPAPSAAAGRPSSSGSASLTASAASRPTSAGSSSSSGGVGGIRSKLSLKRKRTNANNNSTSKPSSASDPRQSEAAAASQRKQRGSTRRKERVISGVFAARRQAREQSPPPQQHTFSDDLSFQFGGTETNKNNDERGGTTSSNTNSQDIPNRNANSDEDTDPCSSGTDENEFEWSQSRSQRQSQKQQQPTDVGGGGLEDSQDSLASAGSLQSAASDGTDASNGSGGSDGGGNIKKKKSSAKRRKRNASSSASGGHDKPPIPSFSPVEWSSSHGDDSNSDGMKVERKGGKNASTNKETEKEEEDTIKAKPKPKPKATKSVKRVGVGLDSPSSSSSSSSEEDKDGGASMAGATKDNMTSKDDNKMKKVSAKINRSPDINTNDRASLAAARGDNALAFVEAALAKTASKSEADSASAASATTSSAPGDDDAKISGATSVADSANITTPTADAPKSGSKGTTATRGWNCSACTLLNTSRKRKCEACGTGRPSSNSPPEKPAGDVAATNIDSVDANPSGAGSSKGSKGSDATWKCSKCTLDNDVQNFTCDACGKPKPLEASSVASAKSPVIDLSLDDGDETNGDRQQKQAVEESESTTNKKKSATEKPAASAKKQNQSREDSDAKKSKTDISKKAKTSKTSKKAEGTAKAAAGSTKAKAAQKKRKRQQPKKKEKVASSPTDDDIFDVSTSKKISDKEKSRDRQHSDYLRQLAKDPSPGKDSDGDYESASKRTKRAACALCSTCSCSRGAALKGLEEGAKLDATNPISKFARSDAEIERALLGRLGRLEKSASWFDTMCYKVGRELKKHRNKVAKKRASIGGVGEEEAKPRFLADADVDGQDKGVFYPRAKKSRVEKAHQGLFGTEPTVKEAQPTLTQMMKGEDGDDAPDDDGDTGRKQAPKEESKGMELDPVAEDEVVGIIPKNVSVRGAEDGDDIYAIENGVPAPNESIIYEETEEGSPVEVRSPMADYHEASHRGLERASRNSQIGMWNAASSATLSNGNAELPETPKQEATSHSDAEAEDDFNQKVDTAINNDSETGIDDLLELFQEDPPASTPNTPSTEKSLPPPELQSQLTQRGNDAVEELQDAVLADPKRLEGIEAVCPDWRDSIRYPFLHTRPDNLEDALAKVRDSRRKLQESRERILAAIKQREEVHNMFEAALLQSMKRFASGNNSIPRSSDVCNEEKKSE